MLRVKVETNQREIHSVIMTLHEFEPDFPIKVPQLHDSLASAQITATCRNNQTVYPAHCKSFNRT